MARYRQATSTREQKPNWYFKKILLLNKWRTCTWKDGTYTEGPLVFLFQSGVSGSLTEMGRCNYEDRANKQTNKKQRAQKPKQKTKPKNNRQTKTSKDNITSSFV